MNAATADLSSLAADLAYASGKGINLAAQQIIQQTAQRVQEEAQAQAPMRSGALRNSITVRYIDALKAVIGPNVEYGVYQEFGTGSRGEFGGGSYTIRPRGGKFLKYEVNGKTVYSRKVTHPGVRPRRYMRGGLETALGPEMTGALAEKGALLITKGPRA